jgi:hypothetical protein
VRRKSTYTETRTSATYSFDISKIKLRVGDRIILRQGDGTFHYFTTPMSLGHTFPLIQCPNEALSLGEIKGKIYFLLYFHKETIQSKGVFKTMYGKWG